MTVTVWATQQGGRTRCVDVYDARGHRVAADVLVHDGGAFYRADRRAPRANADYYVAVRHAACRCAADPRELLPGRRLRLAPVQWPTYSAGTLTAAVPVRSARLNVSEAEVLHLVFDLSQNAASPTGRHRLTVIDSGGQVVAAASSWPATWRAVNRVPAAGVYRVIVGGGTLDGSPLPNLPFRPGCDPLGPLGTATGRSPHAAAGPARHRPQLPHRRSIGRAWAIHPVTPAPRPRRRGG